MLRLLKIRDCAQEAYLMRHMPKNVIAYFDYLCPFAWRGAEVAQQVAEPLGLTFSSGLYRLTIQYPSTGLFISC